MKFDDEICKGVSCHECSFNKGEDGCLLAERLDEIDITPESCEEHTETHSCDYQRTETHDLVSRRSALEAMDTWDKFGCDPDGKLVRYDDDKHYVPYVHYEDMVHAVKNLPSQPEHTETHSCDYQRTETHEWIPVSEALPEKPFGCLVTVMDTEPMTMEEFENILPYFVGYDGEQWNDWEGHQCPLEVLAWMPIPEPYAERRQDG